MRTIKLKAVGGVRNDLSPERFANGDLSVGVNIDIDETGKTYRREGRTSVVAGNMHSLFSDGGTSLVVKDAVLSQLNPDMSLSPLVPVAGARLSYVKINDDVFWSDGVQAGVVAGGENRSWGIAVPPQPLVSALGTGSIPEGRYLCTTTYVRRDGKESGAPAPVAVDVAANGALSIELTPSSDPFVSFQLLYLSTPNGELPYLAARVSNGVRTLTLSALPNLGMPVRTLFMGPPPAGQLVKYYAGRSYLARGPYLCYSSPYEYELFDLRSGYVGFEGDVRTFSPVSDGVYIGSDKRIFWCEGTDPSLWIRKTVADYGGVLGTECVVPNHYVGREGVNGVATYFMTTGGLHLGLDGGQLKNLTGSRYVPVAAKKGASLLKVRGGSPLLTVSLFN